MNTVEYCTVLVYTVRYVRGAPARLSSVFFLQVRGLSSALSASSRVLLGRATKDARGSQVVPTFREHSRAHFPTARSTSRRAIPVKPA